MLICLINHASVDLSSVSSFFLYRFYRTFSAHVSKDLYTFTSFISALPCLSVSQSVGSMCVCLCASGFFMHLTSAIRAIRLLHYFASFSLSFPLLPLPSLTPSSSSPLPSLIYYRFFLPFLSIFIRIILLSLIISINIHTHYAPFLIAV